MALPEIMQYFALALDPIHVGTGGYRLGRVDMTIVREPGTNLPKIPGTSLSGVTRACSAITTGRYQWDTGKKDEDGNIIWGSCAGQGQGDEGHCGSPECPVCMTFGFARGQQGGFQGLAQFSDARILFFPVYSMLGPVWVTSPSVLAEHGVPAKVADDKVKIGSELNASSGRINLGWLMLENDKCGAFSLDKLQTIPKEIKQRAVLVSDKLFSHIVNDNLEVRTSVSIDPFTGAADEGALFTYEALPRTTVLWFSVTYKDKNMYRVSGKTPEPRENAKLDGNRLEIKTIVDRGLAQIEHLGVGGMNTRGMGRLKVWFPADTDKPAEGQDQNTEVQ